MADPITFDGRVAVVTGAGGSLGRAYAVELARRGARVVVNDVGRDADGAPAAERVVQEIVSAGGEARASLASVDTPDGGAEIVDAATSTYGSVDILINNAGFIRDRSFTNLDGEQIGSVIGVHLLGAFHVTQPAFRVMKEQGYGRILSTASAAGLFGNFGQANYAAAKMGLVGLSGVLAIEGAKYGITSNIISPMAASQGTAELLGDLASSLPPEKVAPLALYLVSDVCTLSHQVFSAGGGRFARVFTGVTKGWMASPELMPSVEDVRDHIERIGDESGYSSPATGPDEIAILVQALAERRSG